MRGGQAWEEMEEGVEKEEEAKRLDVVVEEEEEEVHSC